MPAQPVKFIQRGGGSEVAEVGPRDFLLADNFGFRPFQFFGGQTFRPQEFGFLEQFGFDLRHLGRLGAGVEREVAGHEAGEILRADVVGEAELFADAQKQTRAEVAATFLQEIERVTVIAAERRAGKTDDEHGLLFVARFFDALERSEGRGLRVERDRRRFFPTGKGFFHRGFDVARGHIAKNREHAIVRRGELLMKFFQRGDRNFASRFFRAERIQAVAGLAEQRAAHREARALEQFIFARTDAGDLDFLFAFQFVRGKNGIQDDVGKQVEAGRKIFAQHFGVDAETIIAAVTVNVAADRFNLGGDFFCAARLGALDEQLGEQHGRAVVHYVFGQRAAFKHGAKFHERQAVVGFHQQRQAIRQNDFLDGVDGVLLDVRLGFGRGAFGQQRVKRAVFRREIMARDALNIRERDVFDGGEIAFGEIQVIRGEPVAAEILRLTFHRLARRQRGGNELLDGLLQFVGGDRKHFYFFDLRENGFVRCFELVAVHHGADAEQSRQSGAVSPRVHVMHDALLLAHLLEEARAASAAE